jgi:DNA invertase Pin-like site-specific DNA recombinase
MSFDIYTRVSDEDGRSGPSFGSPAEQEAACRGWAEQHDLEIDEVPYDGNVSGAKPVEERELGRLIRKVEAGASEGILVRYVDRYARDMIEGAMALDRIVKAGGRLIAAESGFDSGNLNADTRMIFNIQLAIAEAQRERNRENRLQGIKRAAERGVYLACQAPVGYTRLADGTIKPHAELKPLIRKAFARRADGETARSIAEWLRKVGGEIEVEHEKTDKDTKEIKVTTVRPLAKITENGVRHLIKSRAYLGEGTKQTGVKGKTETITKAHPPLVTDDQWEAAQAAGGPWHPNNGRWSSQVRLAGLVYCQNGHRLKTGRSGDQAAYLCTHADCDARASVKAEWLDAWVEGLITDSVIAREPHVVAILEGDDRYQRALEAVEEARVELGEFVDTVKVTEVGKDAWIRGKEARQAALDLARKALREIPKKKEMYTGKHPGSAERIVAAMNRDANGRLVSRVVVKPVGKGRRSVPVAERAEIWLIGAEEALDPATVQPVGDPETDAILAAAHTPEALKAAAAHSAAEVAATEAAYEVAHTPKALRKLGGAAPVELAAEHRAKEGA